MNRYHLAAEVLSQLGVVQTPFIVFSDLLFSVVKDSDAGPRLGRPYRRCLWCWAVAL
jgi:hypothetical protein